MSKDLDAALQELHTLQIDTINIKNLTYQYRYNGFNADLEFTSKGQAVHIEDDYDLQEFLIAASLHEQMEKDGQVNHDSSNDEDEDEDGEDDEHMSPCNWDGSDSASTEILKSKCVGITLLDNGNPLGDEIAFDIGSDS